MNVKPEGNPASDIWIIGEAVGPVELQHGAPFAGGAGTILNGMLREAGIERGNCYLDNIITNGLTGYNFNCMYTDKKLTAPTQELVLAQERIRSAIREHKPKVVIAFGNEVMKALIGHGSIMHWRGSIIDFEGSKVTRIVPVCPPGMIMKEIKLRPIAVMDILKAKRVVEEPGFPHPYKDNFIISPSFETCMHYLTKVLPLKPKLAFDIESDMRERGQILCCGFGWSKEDAICIPIMFGGNSWWSAEEELAIVDGMVKLFAKPEIQFIAQNDMFDELYLRDIYGIRIANVWLDTMIAFHTLYPEFKKSLDFINSIYTTRNYHKGMVGASGPNKGVGPDNLWTYNCIDCVSTFEDSVEIVKELKEYGMWDFYRNVSHALIRPLMEIQSFGTRIDMDARAKIDANLVRDIEEMKVKLNEAVGHELNPNSPKQMCTFLYEELKMPPQYNTVKVPGGGRKKTLTADEDALNYLAKNYPSPVFDLCIDIRKAIKLLSTYIRAEVDPDNRIRCSYNIAGTVTGRLSSKESIHCTGTNLQNIPRGPLVRSLFIADPGYKLVDVDLSQAESRVVAYLANDYAMIRVFETDGDVHIINASNIYNVPQSEVTKPQRDGGKKVGHASNYMIGAKTFSNDIGCSVDEAQRLLNRYYQIYPGVKVWHKKVEKEVSTCRILTTPLGRKRMFFGRYDQDLIRGAVAYVPQSTVGDHINISIVKAYPYLPDGWNFINQVHDSIMTQVPEDTDDLHIYKFFKHYFERPITINGHEVIIPIDIKVGKSWGTLQKLKLEL